MPCDTSKSDGVVHYLLAQMLLFDVKTVTTILNQPDVGRLAIFWFSTFVNGT